MTLYFVYDLDKKEIYKEEVGRLKAIYYNEIPARRKITVLRRKDPTRRLTILNYDINEKKIMEDVENGR